jgi:hypothetical protein
MTIYAEHAGLTVTDAPLEDNLDFILKDAYGNTFPISDAAEMADIAEAFVKSLDDRTERIDEMIESLEVES